MSDVMTGRLPPTAATAAGSGSETAGDARQFVIFHVKDEMFAVPLAEVQEIIRMPDVVRMPMSPAALEGLANLRGTVLPVINLRSVFGFDQVEPRRRHARGGARSGPSGRAGGRSHGQCGDRRGQ